MDFNDTPEEAAFRSRVRRFLEANAEPRTPGKVFGTRYGDDSLVEVARDWQRRKYEAGFAGITLPKEFGGQGGVSIQQAIYNQEEAEFLTPVGVYEIGIGMCVPTMLRYATETQKRELVPPALRGEQIWCQLFSEPAAGSDLAGLRTRAVRDGSNWIINGQKVWTSGAHFSDWGVLVTRSDPAVPKHKGLTYFFIDMSSPGIEIRRIKQISGTSNFNEVFFTDLKIPDAQRLGAEGEGWSVALTTLMNERLAVGGSRPPDFDEIWDLVQTLELESGPAIRDTAVREKLAQWYIESRGVRLTGLRNISALSRGDTPGPESSIMKVVSGTKRQAIARFATELLDQCGAINDPALSPMRALFQDGLLASPSTRIAGGSDEILRNIIAERVLGLPQEVRVDKSLPFDQLPGSGR